MKLLVESYGCSLNRGEGAEFVEAAIAAGHSLTDLDSEADAAVLFTCGVIETTERRMLKRISQLSKIDNILICGCLGEIVPEKIKYAAPKAMIFPPSAHLAALDCLGKGDAAEYDIKSTGIVRILPIASGCSGECAYCVTRLARGELKSRSPDEIAKRARALIEGGAAEIHLCAQDTAIYGDDCDAGLDYLISRISEIEGDFMLRIGMMKPDSALDGIDKILAAYDNEKVFKFLHLPVQSGSDAVLERMGRGYAVADFQTVLNLFRAKFPDSTISTDIITGFPGETDKEFEKTLWLIGEIKPDVVNVTRFSARPGTRAVEMKNQVPGRISKDRSRLLTELRFEITANIKRGRAGKVVRALATEMRGAGKTFLRTDNYWPIVADGEKELGKWYSVEITGYVKTHLLGEIHPKP